MKLFAASVVFNDVFHLFTLMINLGLIYRIAGCGGDVACPGTCAYFLATEIVCGILKFENDHKAFREYFLIFSIWGFEAIFSLYICVHKEGIIV